MADVRLPAALPPASTPTPARSTEAVRAAQRAFFNTALADAQAPVAARTPTPTPQVAAAPATPLRATATPAADGSTPARPLRPGSLLDIRI